MLRTKYLCVEGPEHHLQVEGNEMINASNEYTYLELSFTSVITYGSELYTISSGNDSGGKDGLLATPSTKKRNFIKNASKQHHDEGYTRQATKVVRPCSNNEKT